MQGRTAFSWGQFQVSMTPRCKMTLFMFTSHLFRKPNPTWGRQQQTNAHPQSNDRIDVSLFGHLSDKLLEKKTSDIEDPVEILLCTSERRKTKNK